MMRGRGQELALCFNGLTAKVWLPKLTCSCLYAAAARFYGRPVSQVSIYSWEGPIPCVAAPLPDITSYQVRAWKGP